MTRLMILCASFVTLVGVTSAQAASGTTTVASNIKFFMAFPKSG